jgi:hypothetical protein
METIMAVITRVFDDLQDADTARNNVNALGLPGVEVSILGNETMLDTFSTTEADGSMTDRGAMAEESAAATGAGIGATVGGGAGLLAGLGMLAIPGIGQVVAAGWLAATAIGVAGGALAGGAVGALVDLGPSEDDAPVFSEAMRRGGVAVSPPYSRSVYADGCVRLKVL